MGLVTAAVRMIDEGSGQRSNDDLVSQYTACSSPHQCGENAVDKAH